MQHRFILMFLRKSNVWIPSPSPVYKCTRLRITVTVDRCQLWVTCAWVQQNSLGSKVATPTASGKVQKKRKKKENKAPRHQLPWFVTPCPLDMSLAELYILTAPPSAASVNIHLSHSVCLLLCVPPSPSGRSSNHCHEKNDRQRNNWGNWDCVECVITANHRNEGTGWVSVSGGQMDIADLAQG